jgi:predicted membrane protein
MNRFDNIITLIILLLAFNQKVFIAVVVLLVYAVFSFVLFLEKLVKEGFEKEEDKKVLETVHKEKWITYD